MSNKMFAYVMNVNNGLREKGETEDICENCQES